MNARRTFAVMYFVGMTTGLCAGSMLPWWISGAPAYALAWAVHDIASHLPIPRGETMRVPDGGLLRCQISWARILLIRSAVWGAFIGALSGAVAADMPELYARMGFTSRALDGHACGAMAAALVLSDAWVRGDGGRPLSPGWRGVVLYIAFVLVAGVLPVLPEVLR